MKKKNFNGKLNLSKKTISNFQSTKVKGGTGNNDQEPVDFIDNDPNGLTSGEECRTQGGAPTCAGCRLTGICIGC